LQRSGGWPRLCEDYIGSQSDQFFRESLHLSASGCIAAVDVDIAAFKPSKLFEFCPKRLCRRIVVAQEHADTPDVVGLCV
jgi:hypothetical protein